MIIDGITDTQGTGLKDGLIEGADLNTNTNNGVAKAWLYYNGVSETINSSFNIASVVRNSTGNYTVTFSTPMTDDNYVVSIWNNSGGSGHVRYATVVAQNTATFQFDTRYNNDAGVVENQPFIHIVIFGN